MKNKTLFDGFITKLRENKKLEICVYALLILAAVVIFAATGGISCDRSLKGQTLSSKGSSSEEELESRLESILSSIEGAGRVRVMLTGGTQQEGGASQGGTLSGLFAEATPEPKPRSGVNGVIVVAEGAADPAVRIRLHEAVVTVLGLEASRVSVFSMNETDKHF